MWPFRRGRDQPEESAGAPGQASPGASEADVARPARVATGDWMTLPAVPTAASATMPTTFRVQTLPEILTSHHDTRLSGSLGHAVSAEAPSGTVGGLATTAGAHATAPAGRAATVLREPAHRDEPGPPPPPSPPPLLQRRLATVNDAGPTAESSGSGDQPMSSIAAPAATLPEPAVSRVLASPAAMSSPALRGDHPLPVARVVDTAALPGATPPAPAHTSATPESGDDAGDRVGGFEVDLASLLGQDAASDDDVPLITPPSDLAPPIQPAASRHREVPGPLLGGPSAHADPSSPPPLRAPVPHRSEPDPPSVSPTPDGPAITASPPSSLQPERRVPGEVSMAGPATGAGADAPTTTGPMPPIQRVADPGAVTTGATATSDAPAIAQRAPATRTPAEAPAAPSAPADDDFPPRPDRPTVGLADDGPLTATRFDPPAAAGGAATAGDLPLAAVQRAAEGGAASAGSGGADSAHFDGDGHDHGVDEAPTDPAQPTMGEAPAGAPLAGPSPPGSDIGFDAADDGQRDEGRASGLPAGEDLPLVSRHAEPAAPTLGVDAGEGPPTLPLPLQTLSDTVTAAAGTGTEALPLAPPEQPRTLVPPAGSGPSAPASGPAATSSSSPGGPVGEGRPFVAASTPSHSARAASGPASSALVAQRQLAPTAGTAFATSGTGGADPAGIGASSAGVLTLAAPLGRASLAARSEVSGVPMTVLDAPPGEASVVPLQRRFDADAIGIPAPDEGFSFAAGTSEPGTSASSALRLGPSGAPAAAAGSGSPGPLMAQRSTSSISPAHAASPTTATSPGRPSPGDSGALPLHTAAASVPSTTDLLVKAGLGERGSDGSFLRATPPAGTESSFTVQTAPASPSSGASPASVQRAVTLDEVTTSVSPNPTSGGGAGGSGGDLPQDPRKLYRKIRAELEADIRRQLEAKNRYNRFRP